MKKHDPTPVIGPTGTPIDTGAMTDEEFTQIRQYGGYIVADDGSKITSPIVMGGSDAAVVVGDSPFKTVTEFFNEKVGNTPKVTVEFNAAAKAAGHQFEDAVAQSFVNYMAKECNTEVELVNDTIMYGNELYPFAHVNLDRRIVSMNGMPCNGILECKTTSYRNYDTVAEWKDGIVPKYYEDQVRFYMAVMNVDFAYIICSWGFKPDETSVILIQRDDEYEEELMGACEDFVKCCIDNEMPQETNPRTDLLNQYYLRYYGEPDSKAKPVELGSNCLNIVQSALDIDEELKKAKELVSELEAKRNSVLANLYPLFGNAGYASIRLDDKLVAGIRLKVPMHKAKLDMAKLKTEQPDVYDKYTKPVFQEAEFKKSEKKLSREYMLPAEVNGEKQPTYELSVKEIPA